MPERDETRCRQAARVIARELGVRIDHPGTDRLARALAGARSSEVVFGCRAFVAPHCRSRASIGRPAEHPAGPLQRNREDAEAPLEGR
jgi:hypothetical protein